MAITAHRIYVAVEGDVLDFNSPMVEVQMPDTNIDLPDEMPNFPTPGYTLLTETIQWSPGSEGPTVNYQIGISTVDDSGNESSMAVKTVPFASAAPTAPTIP